MLFRGSQCVMPLKFWTDILNKIHTGALRDHQMSRVFSQSVYNGKRSWRCLLSSVLQAEKQIFKTIANVPLPDHSWKKVAGYQTYWMASWILVVDCTNLSFTSYFIWRHQISKRSHFFLSWLGISLSIT